MWTRENRGLYERKGARYPSDLRDDDWVLIAPVIPPAKHGGRKRAVNLREVMNGVLYVLETGCQWRVAQGPATQVDGARLSDAVGLGRHAGAGPPRALPLDPGPGGPGGQSDGRGDRHSECERRGKKGGRAAIRRAMARPRKSKARSATSSSTPSA
jgi:hypothetical protein